MARWVSQGSWFGSVALAATVAGLAQAQPALSPPTQPRSGAPAAPASDPLGSLVWPDLQREFLGAGPVRFDARVQVRGPAFADDPVNVPITVSADGIDDIELITVLVDLNPIKKVLEYQPLGMLPRVSFRFKLEQSSPVRAAVKTRDGVWNVGGTLVDSSGGGCTVAGVTRNDGSWSRSLGKVSAKVFPHSAPPMANGEKAARVRLRVMHPMDTGLVAGIPAFYVNRLSLRDAAGREVMRLNAFEPVSENPVFSFDFAGQPTGPLTLVGTDNNGNRIASAIE